MTDEIKMKAECQKIINRAGMAMIAERKTENQQARLSNIQSSDVLRVLRMLPLIFLRKFF